MALLGLVQVMRGSFAYTKHAPQELHPSIQDLAARLGHDSARGPRSARPTRTVLSRMQNAGYDGLPDAQEHHGAIRRTGVGIRNR